MIVRALTAFLIMIGLTLGAHAQESPPMNIIGDAKGRVLKIHPDGEFTNVIFKSLIDEPKKFIVCGSVTYPEIGPNFERFISANGRLAMERDDLQAFPELWVYLCTYRGKWP